MKKENNIPNISLNDDEIKEINSFLIEHFISKTSETETYKRLEENLEKLFVTINKICTKLFDYDNNELLKRLGILKDGIQTIELENADEKIIYKIRDINVIYHNNWLDINKIGIRISSYYNNTFIKFYSKKRINNVVEKMLTENIDNNMTPGLNIKKLFEIIKIDIDAINAQNLLYLIGEDLSKIIDVIYDYGNYLYENTNRARKLSTLIKRVPEIESVYKNFIPETEIKRRVKFNSIKKNRKKKNDTNNNREKILNKLENL